MSSFPTLLPVVTMWAAENLTELLVTIEPAPETTLPDLRTATNIQLVVVPNPNPALSDPLTMTATSATTAALSITPTTFPSPGTFTAQPIVTWATGMVTRGSKFTIVIDA